MSYGLGHSEFTTKVISAVRQIPEGKIATYKQIAGLAGKPHASRGVAWILNTCSTQFKLPWHRVINAQGKISFDKTTHNYRQQKRRLENEGVIFAADGKLDLTEFQWKKQPRKTKTSKRKPKMFL